MRSQANTASEVILVIPQGTSVSIDEDCDCKWIPITYNGQIGYVSSKYLNNEKTSIEVPYRSSVKYYTNSSGEKYKPLLVTNLHQQEQQLYAEMERTALVRAGELHALIMTGLLNSYRKYSEYSERCQPSCANVVQFIK